MVVSPWLSPGLSSPCCITSHLLHSVCRDGAAVSVWEGEGCTHPSWAAVHRMGCTHSVTQQGTDPAGVVPKGCYWSQIISFSESPVLSLIWVDERPWGQLSASPCPVPRAESISHGHAHPHPRAKGLCTQSPTTPKSAPLFSLAPWGCHLWLATEEAGGCPVPNQLLFAGALWAMGLHRPGGSRSPHDSLGTDQPALWLRAIHSKSLQTRSREGTVCTGSTIQRPGFSPLHEGSCLHPGQTLVTLALQSKHPLT